jgi:hypothetical protein
MEASNIWPFYDPLLSFFLQLLTLRASQSASWHSGGVTTSVRTTIIFLLPALTRPYFLTVEMLLIQGIMSAVSAGMLMYAACVEMLAGDFVMDPILWRSELWKQALALVSLGAGVVAMALVGM